MATLRHWLRLPTVHQVFLQWCPDWTNMFPWEHGCQVQKDVDWGFLSPMLVECKGRINKGKKKTNYIVVH